MQHFIPYLLTLGLLSGQHLINQREEITGPFRTVYKWKTVDYEYPDDLLRNEAITNGDFIPVGDFFIT